MPLWRQGRVILSVVSIIAFAFTIALLPASGTRTRVSSQKYTTKIKIVCKPFELANSKYSETLQVNAQIFPHLAMIRNQFISSFTRQCHRRQDNRYRKYCLETPRYRTHCPALVKEPAREKAFIVFVQVCLLIQSDYATTWNHQLLPSRPFRWPEPRRTGQQGL